MLSQPLGSMKTTSEVLRKFCGGGGRKLESPPSRVVMKKLGLKVLLSQNCRKTALKICVGLIARTCKVTTALRGF